VRTIEWHEGTVVTFDQCRLPHETKMIELNSPEEIAEAINTMKIRGAPLLGATAAYALALAAYHSKAKTKSELISGLEKTAKMIRETRPTAVNLFWALNRIMKKAKEFPGNTKALAKMVIDEADKIADEDAEANRSIGKYGAELIKDGETILTHCNAGALATVDYGTALGVIRAAWEQHKKIKVIATETRPRLQGARLTAYELHRGGIPVTLITDNMVGFVMHKRMVNKVIVGADRIVRDGIVNKIGTFTVALAANEHEIPFYVAAPTSTFDLEHHSKDVVIEEREPEEVTHIGTVRIAPEGVKAFNPAFDITPLKYVTAIICETGIIYKADFQKLESKTSR
jgi:methylthioribose-1-phosphate isomerase